MPDGSAPPRSFHADAVDVEREARARVYDRKQQAYVQKIISSMQNTLRKYHAERIIHKSYNSLALNTALADCDYYDFIRGNSTGTKTAYTGSFMAQYSWAEFMAGYLDRIQRKF